MAFEHAVARAWGNWLRRSSASRGQNEQVIGQAVEDDLRATIQAIDVRHLETPLDWAQAATRRQVAGVALQVANIELHCQSRGGLWVHDLSLPAGAVVVQILEAPLTVPDRTTIVDFGTIDTVSLVGGASLIEAVPVATLPVIAAGAFSIRYGVNPLFVPFGKVLSLKGTAQNTTINVELLSWREIP
ncbi:MAG: hypothetical protein V3T08_10195 [Gemmatimonadota bacterium]